jgi:hypothetical protein
LLDQFSPIHSSATEIFARWNPGYEYKKFIKTIDEGKD